MGMTSPMDIGWMQFGTLVPAVITLFLCVQYVYLYRVRRDRFSATWALAWICQIPMYLSMFALTTWNFGPAVFIVAICNTGTCLLLLAGAFSIRSREIGKGWVVLGALSLASLPVLMALGVRPPWSLTPTVFLVGAVTTVAGVQFLKARKEVGWFGSIAGWALVLEGVHAFDFPLLRSVPHAAPFGHLVSALFRYIVASAGLLYALDTANRALMHSEEKYRSYVDHSPEGLIVFDADGFVVESNLAASRLLGFLGGELLGRHESELLSGVRLSGLASILFSGGTREYEMGLNAKDGSVLPVAVGYSRLHDGWSMVSLRDLRPRIASEREREEIRRQMFLSSKLASLGELAAGVAHEINNPLTIVIGNAETLRGKFLGQDNPALVSDREETLEVLLRAARRIAELVKGLRTLARMDKSTRSRIDVVAAIEETLGLVRTLYSKEGVEVSFVRTADSFHVLGHVGRLHQVVMNLLANAKDASEGQVVRVIELRLSRQGGMVVLSVSDNGKGMTAAVREKVFDAFFTTKEVGRGTGLGLSIVKSIVAELEGHISVTSEPGQGATFTVEIPADDSVVCGLKNPEALPHPATHLSGSVLVVDDEAELTRLLSNLLVTCGLTVHTALDGENALAKIASNHYDVVLTDRKMPGMSGDELAVRLRQMPSFKGRIILVSGTVDPVHSPCFDGYLFKPFSVEDLVRAIRPHLPVAS